MAWKSGEIKRRKVTFNAAQIPGDLTDFVSWVDFSAYHTGSDIFVTKADGTTEIPREVLASGEVWSKYSGVLSSSLDTDIYFYYDSGAADYAVGATYGRNNVWTLFEMVLHLLEDAAGTGTAGLYVDRTGNGYDGDDNISATGKAGKVGAGQQFNGIGDSIDIATDWQASLPVSVVMWLNPASFGAYNIIFHSDTWTSNYRGIVLQHTNLGHLFPGYGRGTGTGTTSRKNKTGSTIMTTGSWQHVGVVIRALGNNIDIYLNGIDDGGTYSGSAPSMANSTTTPGIGTGETGSQAFSGSIDELWIAASDLGANYIAALYNNQNSPGTFYTIGPEETAQATTSRPRETIWI